MASAPETNSISNVEHSDQLLLDVQAIRGAADRQRSNTDDEGSEAP